MKTIEELTAQLGQPLFEWQRLALEDWMATPAGPRRKLLYYRTGAGKTLTSLLLLAALGEQEALVIAPPSTHSTWTESAGRLGITLTTISHAKFRQSGYLVKKTVPVLADEFHLFGGHGGKGWKKLDRLAKGLQAPLILMSATPNYNDAERVYCIKHILDPEGTKGGYLEFLYQHCQTQQNKFRLTPDVIGFLQYADAEDFLKNLPHVLYVPDNTEYAITELDVYVQLDDDFVELGLNHREKRVIASQMERRHTTSLHTRTTDDGLLKAELLDLIEGVALLRGTPILIFTVSSKLAEIVYRSLQDYFHLYNVELVTGKTPLPHKQKILQNFRDKHYDILVGTATLGTGTDGLDKVCDTLIILQDTDDDAFRRQLIGRILPRGESADASGKAIYRVNMLT